MNKMEGNSASAVATAPSFARKHLNGGTMTTLPDKPSMEKISSLQENPFFTKFGLKSALGARSRHVPESQQDRRWRLNSNGSLDVEDQPEYRPGSGFVHKLRDKWSHLNAREEVVLKRASSLEDLQPGEEAGISKVISPRVAGQSLVEKKHPNVLHPAKLAYRAQSIESLSQAHSKPLASHQHSGHRQNPPFVHPLRHVDPAWGKEKPSVPALKSPRNSHIEAPDVDLARDDIIIIEKVPQQQPESDSKDTSESESESNVASPPLSYREEILPNELPKPNTVQTVRNIFETNSSLPSWKNSVISKRRTSDTPPVSLSLSSATSHSPTTSGFSIAGSSPVTSPRLYSSDNHAKPIFSPSAINTPSPQWNEAEHLRPRSGSGTSSSLLSPSQTSKLESTSSSSTGPNNRRERLSSLLAATESTSEAKVSSTSSAEEKTTSVYQRSHIYDSPRFGETPTPRSPRNMASVKPTVSSKPSSPVKPLPLSTPASAATSYTKSSPVMSVAPYNDKPDDSKDDGLPTMIFQKSKISPKREKTPRINNYSPVTEAPKGLPVDNIKKDKDNAIIPNHLKKPSTVNKVNNVATKIEISSKGKSAVDTDRIIQTSQQTTIHVGLSKEKEAKPDKKEDKSSNIEAEVSSSPVLPTKKTQAPTAPVVDKVKSKLAPDPPKAKETPSQSMLYLSSSESGESDSSTPPETPRNLDDAKVQNGTRGVPSLITVSRLKQDREPAPPRFSTSAAEKANGEPTVLPSVPSLSLEKQMNSSSFKADSEKASIVDKSLTSSSVLNQAKPIEKRPDPIERSVKLPPKPIEDATKDDKPIKGVSTFIANKLQKNKTNPSQMTNTGANNFVTLDLNLNDESSTDSDVSPRPPINKQSPGASPSSSPFAVNLKPSGSSSTSSNSTDTDESEPNQFKSVLRKSGANKSSAVQIFDSSKLAEKRKKNQQAAGLVPRLNLAGINDDKTKVYMSPQKEVKPCNIVCIGANTKTDRSLLAKNRVKKVNITFKTQVEETFEYLSEKSALETYLEEHPDDKEDDILFMDTSSGGGFGESSDDKDDDDYGVDNKDDEPTTPRGKGAGEEELLKSNTSLSSSGNLQSYQGRFQESFDWSALRQEPEPVKVSSLEPEPEDPDSMMLRPADEEDTNTWSTSSVADILF